MKGLWNAVFLTVEWPHNVQDQQESNPELPVGYYCLTGDRIQMGNILLAVNETKECGNLVGMGCQHQTIPQPLIKEDF